MAALAASEVESKMGSGNVAASVSFVILITVGWRVELVLRYPLMRTSRLVTERALLLYHHPFPT